MMRMLGRQSRSAQIRQRSANRTGSARLQPAGSSKRYYPLQQPKDESGPVRIRHDSFAVENDFHICDRGRKNNVVRGDVGLADNSANAQDLTLAIDGDFFDSLNTEITVRKHFGYARGDERLQLSGAGSGPLTSEGQRR